MVNDSVKVSGSLKIVVTNQDGTIKDERDVENLVVTVGKEFLVNKIIGTGASVTAGYMGVGTGAVAAAAGDTALGAELTTGSTRPTTATSVETTTTTNDTAQFVATFAAGLATGAITEAGLFSAITGGTMISRTVFAVVNKGALDGMTITWKLKLA